MEGLAAVVAAVGRVRLEEVGLDVRGDRTAFVDERRDAPLGLGRLGEAGEDDAADCTYELFAAMIAARDGDTNCVA